MGIKYKKMERKKISYFAYISLVTFILTPLGIFTGLIASLLLDGFIILIFLSDPGVFEFVSCWGIITILTPIVMIAGIIFPFLASMIFLMDYDIVL